MSISLNLQDRYYLSMYSRRLPCTLQLRFVIDSFLDMINITSDEFNTYGCSIEPNTLLFVCKDTSYIKEYESFPEPVIKAMKEYISVFDHDEHSKNSLLQNTFEVFRKII